MTSCTAIGLMREIKELCYCGHHKNQHESIWLIDSKEPQKRGICLQCDCEKFDMCRCEECRSARV